MLRLAIAQSPAGLQSPTDRLNWLRNTLPQPADNGADIVVLPELFACGYNIGGEVLARAETLEGSTFCEIRGMAQEFGLAIHYGFSERSGDALYNAAQCVSKQGNRLCHQRKLAIPPGFERSYFTAGQGCSLFDFCGIKIATLICYDAEFPETVRHVAALGAELVLVPTALSAQWPCVAHKMIPTRAFENGVFLAYINSAGVENGLEFLGASVIAAPDGTEVARAREGPEVLYAELSSERVKAAQTRLPYLNDRFSISLLAEQ